MAEHFQSPMPQPVTVERAGPRANIEGALEQARLHLDRIQHNPRAVQIQLQIIARYEAQLRELTERDWLET
jgi:hypothetical protein